MRRPSRVALCLFFAQTLGFLLPALHAHAESPPCWPAPASNGSRLYHKTNAAGFAVIWYCKAGDKWTDAARFYGHWSELSPDWALQIPKLLYGTDAERNAVLATAEAASLPDSAYANTVFPLLQQLHSEHDAEYSSMAAPIGPKYIVQRESSTVAGTRPVYRLRADGTWSTTAVSSKRVAGGSPAGPLLPGTTNRCNMRGFTYTDSTPITEDVFAVCVKAQ